MKREETGPMRDWLDGLQSQVSTGAALGTLDVQKLLRRARYLADTLDAAERELTAYRTEKMQLYPDGHVEPVADVVALRAALSAAERERDEARAALATARREALEEVAQLVSGLHDAAAAARSPVANPEERDG